MANWVKLMPIAAIPQEKLMRYKAADQAFVVLRRGEKFYCFTDLCSHMDVPLSKGEIKGNELICKAHGAKFDLDSGKALCMPATSPIEKVPVKVENGTLFVDWAE